ncbi:hypothetical protein BD626DRAFT_500696 [Schizophyllum amplum]|uniref:Secreted protein n=1 Tax=Schizophyllum amplum TaxID=97359 RepID=A0A550CAL4_9AGAR|nr:hypothetical protein BD626DRAFT_500696 [Auriculariopsis ampla]
MPISSALPAVYLFICVLFSHLPDFSAFPDAWLCLRILSSLAPHTFLPSPHITSTDEFPAPLVRSPCSFPRISSSLRVVRAASVS